jgi:hypothetical protein
MAGVDHWAMRDRGAWAREWRKIPPAERWDGVDMETLPADRWPTVLWDCLGQECYMQFAAFAYPGDFETSPRSHGHGANARYNDSDVARIRNNDDLLTGVTFADRQVRLGEVMRLVLCDQAEAER